MGKQGLRYAAKVSLDKPADEQEVLHVCIQIIGGTDLNLTVIESLASRQYALNTS